MKIMNKLDPFEEIISNKLNQHQVDFSYDSWDAIEKKLPKPNSNITSIIAIGLILVTSSLLIISSYIGTENSSKKIITSSNPLKENISTDLVKEFQQNENTNTFHSNDEIEMSEIITTEKIIKEQKIKNKQDTYINQLNNDNNEAIFETENNSNEEIETPINPENIDTDSTSQISHPIAEFTVSKTDICQEESINFHPTENESYSYYWDFNDGSSSYDSSPNHVFKNSGEFRVTLTTTNANNLQTVSDAIMITVNEIPQSDFQFEKQVEDGTPKILFNSNNSFNATNEWDFGDGHSSTLLNPEHKFHKKGTYLISLKQTNEYNCSSSTTKPLEIKENFNLYAPNSFTPDGDGINDSFIPESLKLMNVEFIMTIYNKQGKLIYKTTNINQPWDGYNQNTGEKCIQGSYIWVVQLINKFGENEQFKGPLLLLN
jgi:gliding motility-associated-like protein